MYKTYLGAQSSLTAGKTDFPEHGEFSICVSMLVQIAPNMMTEETWSGNHLKLPSFVMWTSVIKLRPFEIYIKNAVILKL